MHLVRWQTIRNFDTRLSNALWCHNPNDGTTRSRSELEQNIAGLTLQPYQTGKSPFAGDTTARIHRYPIKTSIQHFRMQMLMLSLLASGFSCHGRAQFLGLVACQNQSGESFTKKGITLDLAFQVVLWEPRTVTGHPFPGVTARIKPEPMLGRLPHKSIFEDRKRASLIHITLFLY